MSSSGVHGPFLIPNFSQQGGLPIWNEGIFLLFLLFFLWFSMILVEGSLWNAKTRFCNWDWGVYFPWVIYIGKRRRAWVKCWLEKKWGGNPSLSFYINISHTLVGIHYYGNCRNTQNQTKSLTKIRILQNP